MSNLNESEDLEPLLYCPRCGNLRKLVNQKTRAETVGLNWPANLPHFTIECCGYQLSIEDNKTYLKLIDLLKKVRPDPER
jgi:hypothetical protein